MAVLLTLVRRRKGSDSVPYDGEALRRLDSSVTRARYWVTRTPREAVRLLRRVRLYNIAAAVLTTITGLLAWPLVDEGSRLTAQIVLSTLSCLAAVAVAVPYATGLHDRVEASIKLCGMYGALYGELLRARSQVGTSPTTQPPVTELIQQLHDLTARKDALALAAPAPDGDEASGEHPAPVHGAARPSRAEPCARPATGPRPTGKRRSL
ncbi:hypothetical protein [Streptomyces sp. NPDC056628]|uniref:hypothetical protein n=1 Tax=Streptomyces sp. NPDC056628 TaxID=3345882 RepID=UPI0036CAEE5C